MNTNNTKTINVQELAVEFLTKLSDRYTPEEQAQILGVLNTGLDNFGEVIKTILDPKKRYVIMEHAQGLFNDNQQTIERLGFQLNEHFS